MTLPADLKAPDGCVILGLGGAFKVPNLNDENDFLGYSYWPGCGTEWTGPRRFLGNQIDMIYAAPSDSEIARLNSREKTEGSDTPRAENHRLRCVGYDQDHNDRYWHSEYGKIERELSAALDSIDAENRKWTAHSNELVEQLVAKDALIGELVKASKALIADMTERAKMLADYNGKPVELPVGNGVLHKLKESIRRAEQGKEASDG